MNNTMYKKVVVPLDGSPLAEVALPYAEEIAGKIGSEMVLFTVLSSEEPEEYQNHYTYTEKVVDLTLRQVKKYSEGNGNGGHGNGGCTVCTATRIGNPAEGILDYIDKGHLCLVVMATHGRSGIGRWAVGSVADKVVRSTTRQPLLLIRARGAYADVRAKRILKKALLPLDGSTESEAMMPFIATFAASLKMEITLLRVIPRTNHTLASIEDYLQKWCRWLEEKGITARYEVRIGAPADHIIDLADELACDLVAMSTHGHAAGNFWPLGSVTQKVLLGGNTPLLLVRA
jgi:nucleotide-binding universal stress UspA family protein